MAKQLIISVMEDVVGEYILNISKENLKIAALQGKVKLENVQLDGDLIGSHVLGAVGLSGFGVLSCWAKTVKIIVPLKNLEKMPTRFEIHGVHLLCVPLLPSTAHRRYGAGTAVDPRCSLRTRAKRSALARVERNYFAGRIPGEGPPTRRIRIAMKHAERELRKSKRKKTWRNKKSSVKEEDLDEDDVLFTDLESSLFGESIDEKKSQVPESLVLPPATSWKVRLREKVLRNMEASVVGVHVRCEVSEGGLDFSHPGQGKPRFSRDQDVPADQRAFAFGVTIDNFAIRTAKEGEGLAKWEAFDEESSMASRTPSSFSSLASSTSGEVKNKVATVTNLSVYWDDQPPTLLSECYIMTSKDHNLSPNRLQSRIAAAMEAMVTFQDPGDLIRLSLMKSDGTSPTRRSMLSRIEEPNKPHIFCCQSFSATVHVQLGDRNQPGPMSLLAECLPLDLNLSFRPNQFVQYNMLKSAMFSQQRFDTMLRQRPRANPAAKPRLWWKYVITCVTTRPNSRPWEDVLKISRSRARYIELVKRKINTSAEGNGFHGGLKDEESFELLGLEDLLPIEALQAFHLIALREVYAMRKEAGKEFFERAETEEIELFPRAQQQRRLPNPFRRAKSKFSKKSTFDFDGDVASVEDVHGSIASATSISKEAIYQEIVARMGKKEWYSTFLLNNASISVTLIQNDLPIIQLDLRATGEVRTFGPARQDFVLDVIHFEIIDPQNRLAKFTPRRVADRGKLLMFEEVYQQPLNMDLELTGSSTLDLDCELPPPPPGIVCRISATKETMALKLGISAHPATLVWSKPCMDAVTEFFSDPSAELQTEVTKQLRNVATPLARKALLALMSPSALALNTNVAAPKVWFPISDETADGAVYFDAGKFLMSIAKQESKTDTVWNFSARDIQMKFVRQSKEGQVRYGFTGDSRLGKETMSVIQPIQVQVEAVLAERELELPTGNPVFDTMSLLADKGPWRKLDICISPICLNLVDAEILARAIGKWYASGLVRVKKRKTHDEKTAVNPSQMPLNKNENEEKEAKLLQAVQAAASGVGILSLHIDRLEMALEGHSKMAGSVSDDASVGTFLSEKSEPLDPRKRRYVVEFLGIHYGRLAQHGVSRNNFLVSDVKIIQIKEEGGFNPSAPNYVVEDLQNCVLVRKDRDDASRRQRSNEKSFASPISPSRRSSWSDGNDLSLFSTLDTSQGAMTETSLHSAPGTTDNDSACFLRVGLLHDSGTHLDEVEIDMNSIVLRITPTTLKDCAKGLRKILELVQLVTQEMERKVHEEGRKARLGRNESSNGLKTSDTLLTGFTEADHTVNTNLTSDSSILFKVTLHEMTLLVGRPLNLSNRNGHSGRGGVKQSHAVVQIVANALVMFQSVENADATGSKTLHASIDNLSATANTDFFRLPPNDVPPMIGPTGAEFRVVYGTENLGSVMSQDVSLDCEALKASLTPNDLFIMKSVIDRILHRLQSFGFQPPSGVSSRIALAKKAPRRRMLSSLVRYQKKGTGIATGIRIEIQRFTFVLLEAFRSKQGTRPLFDFSINDFKGRLGGCMTALSGEYTASLSVKHFNYDLAEWESTIEPMDIDLGVEQMPNEVLLRVSTSGAMQTNVTSVMLKDYLAIDFSILKANTKTGSLGLSSDVHVDPSTLSTIGLRRATEAHTLLVKNETGLDVIVSPFHRTSASRGNREESSTMILAGNEVALDSEFLGIEIGRNSGRRSAVSKLKIQFAPSASVQVGEREPLIDLPISSSVERCSYLHQLQPGSRKDGTESTVSHHSGRCSPDTVFSDNSALTAAEYAYYHAEPVVEWCMQNQRLRASISDFYSLAKGRDLLSSNIWSPGDERFAEQDQSLLSEASESVDEGDADGGRNGKTTTTRPSQRSNWVKPYLKNDSPEWTDMTCILRMARERVMLPDNNWIWLNDWTVDLSGSYGESTDCDGWEYEADFETFNRLPRFYIRGDSCRRRRWTRTRMIRPPPISDPLRPLLLVWETSRDRNDNFVVTVKSHVTFHNNSGVDLALFVSSPSWEEAGLGQVRAGESLPVPIRYAAATYVRFGVPKSRSPRRSVVKMNHMSMSRRIMIVPTGNTSSALVRTVISVNPSRGKEVFMGQDTDRSLHLQIHIISEKGIVTIRIEPVIKICNLLPCELECELGEVDYDSGDESRSVIGPKGRKVSKKEYMKLSIGGESSGVGVNPCLKPHISLRIPGYHWSSWHRIVNRQTSSNTWQPSETEEEWHMNSSESDADYAHEFKSIVYFERMGSGDPLNVIISVEMGHSPILRVFAQFWILDKTGFGSRFCDSFSDILGATPDPETSRRSHLSYDEARSPAIKADTMIPGHQWTIGKDGMTLYFSRKEKIALSIEAGTTGRGTDNETSVSSSWVSPMDISNVIPKTVFSVDESSGRRRFELAVSVTVCPSTFARTKLITLYPRYQIVNLLDDDLIVAQDGWQKVKTCIKPRSSVPFHWERQSLPPKVRLGHAVQGGDILWTNGCIQLDKIGITSMRFPLELKNGIQPMVVQAEVRLATKEQSSAVVVVIWSADEKSNPLYVLRNNTSRSILCRQPLHDDVGEGEASESFLPGCTVDDQDSNQNQSFECGTEFGPMIKSFLGFDYTEEFVWVLRPGQKQYFGFDDPEKLHILEWTAVSNKETSFDKTKKNAFVEVDAMGSECALALADGTEIRCQIGAEHSTKVIEFTEYGRRHRRSLSRETMGKLRRGGKHYEDMLGNPVVKSTTDLVETSEEDDVSFSLRLDLPKISISLIENTSSTTCGREILLTQLDNLIFSFTQNREGYHEMELTLMSLQVDNHVHKSIHPVLVFCPKLDDSEPLVHMSAVRRLQPESSSLVYRYVAIRILDIEIYLDRRTAEKIASFLTPFGEKREEQNQDARDWIGDITQNMSRVFKIGNDRTSADVDTIISTTILGRIYIEQLHLHPVRLCLTFTQEWMEWEPGAQEMMIFQFIRGMASIANAPLKFTSFVVGHVFEYPQALTRIVATHYSSQLTKQIFGIVGSLAILGAPADFISNVGTGVRDFFYEPINGLVHGPAQFVEGLEAGTQSLARGVFVGVVRGAANVAEVVNSNLAVLTADDEFLDERKAHQRMLTDAMSRGETSRDFRQSLYLAGASVARGVKSGTVGIWEQPVLYASKHGPVGFVKGVGKALVGAIVKPVVGVGDAAVLVMNHVSDATSDKVILPKIPKRLRRALPRASKDKPFSVRLSPYNDRAAKAQQIVTAGESLDDVYIGHVTIPSHLIIASDQCLWAINKKTREPWSVSWEEISHFGRQENDKMRITVFGQTGLRSYVFEVDDSAQFAQFYKLMAIQANKMGNGTSNLSELDNSLLHGGLENISKYDIPGIKSRQVNHVFGSFNNTRKRLNSTIKDEIDVIEQCFGRVKKLGSNSSDFFKTLDDEAWMLINSWGQVFSGLSSRRCIAASIINGTGFDIQIKATKLVEGGSPCYSIPTKEFDAEQGVVRPGGAIIFFGWGVVPNLLQAGSVFMTIETNAFVTDLSDKKGRDTYAEAMPGYQIGFLEKSYDETGWWAKYWLLVRKA